MKREFEMCASLPFDERMGAVPQLTALDFAYGRYPDAFDEYAAVNPFVSSNLFALESPRSFA